MQRASGILLHPTSLPGPFGIGEFNDHAYRFIEFLAETGQKVWQVLPLGPTGYGDSPYQCFSAFAGNPLLISPDHLVHAKALNEADLKEWRDAGFDDHTVDYGEAIDCKTDILHKSFIYFMQYAPPKEHQAFEAFCKSNTGWLDDYALFMAIKQANDGAAWNTWADDIARRTPRALNNWRNRLATQIQEQQYYQYQFFKQWHSVKTYAHSKGIQIIGDIPIFVAFDSADAWANRDLFYFDERGNPTVIAGVPPDYFSPTGQRWGNPLYRWDVMAKQGYAWWIERVRASLNLYDSVRIDHFRGFESYWEVPANEPTAIKGQWVKGPNKDLFLAIQRALLPDNTHTSLPIIAEDLGVITPEVEELRDGLNLPGMRILQFAFVADTASNFLPHNYVRNTVAYIGSHDNDTVVGWFGKLDAATRQQVLDYTGTSGQEIHWEMMRLLLGSVANTVIVTLQDVLGLGEEARMNFPGRAEGNWAWRFTPDQITPEIKARLKKLTVTYGRDSDQRPTPNGK
jgi:4-alpha-glucanotransferase